MKRPSVAWSELVSTAELVNFKRQWSENVKSITMKPTEQKFEKKSKNKNKTRWNDNLVYLANIKIWVASVDTYEHKSMTRM